MVTVFQSVHSWLPQTETWIYNQVIHLPSSFQCHIVCENTQNLEQFQIDHIHSIDSLPTWRRNYERALRKLRLHHSMGYMATQAKHLQADILHSHFGPMGFQNMKMARNAKLKHVTTFYGFDVNRLPTVEPEWKERYLQLFRQVDLVLCEGPFMAQAIKELGCPEHKVQVQPLGVNLEQIPFSPRTWNPNEPLRVLLSASFREKKGLPYALEALGILQHQVPLEITLIGDANQEERSQEEKRKIIATIEKHHLESKIRLLGYQPHRVLFEEAYKHHIFLSPSVTAADGDTEGGAPVSIIELGASGMPVVSTTHCDIPFVVREGTGLLTPERDVQGLVQHLQWLIEHPQQWEPMCRAFRDHAEERFDVVKQGASLGEQYLKLLAR